jgi:Spy/CpxP family protein refolding chaperone
MKKLIIAALLIVGMTTFAQDKKERPKRADMGKMTPEQRNERRIERMTTELNLDAAQQEKLKQLYADEAKNREAKMAEMKDKKGQGREMMAEQMKANEGKMKEILTPEQFKKWKSNQEKMRERMQQRMGDRQEGMDDRPAGGDNMEN